MATPEPKYQKTTLVGAAMDPATQAVWPVCPGGGGGTHIYVQYRYVLR